MFLTPKSSLKKFDPERSCFVLNEFAAAEFSSAIEMLFAAKVVDNKKLSNGFIRPLKGITTGVYGSQRILNGKKRRPHYGIDIASPKGTPIKSPNDGKVVLAERDLFFTGGTLMIDHGHGLISIYSHLENLKVERNQQIKKGQIIGTVGSTGRSTGPHLDFRLYWNNIAVDPDLVFKN